GARLSRPPHVLGVPEHRRDGQVDVWGGRVPGLVDAPGPFDVFTAAASELGAHPADVVDDATVDVEHDAARVTPGRVVVVAGESSRLAPAEHQVRQRVVDVGLGPLRRHGPHVVVDEEQVLAAGVHECGDAAVLRGGDALVGHVVGDDEEVRHGVRPACKGLCEDVRAAVCGDGDADHAGAFTRANLRQPVDVSPAS